MEDRAPRQSILMRRQKAPSMKNRENREREYQHEEDKWAAKREHYAKQREERKKRIEPAPLDRFHLQQNSKKDMEQALLYKQQKYDNTQEDIDAVEEMEENNDSYFAALEKQRNARKKIMNNVLQDNLALSEYRNKQKAEKLARERELDKENADKDFFFGRIKRSFR